MLIAIAALAYGGWKAWPWWSPLAAFALLLPLTAYKLFVVHHWRLEAGLRSNETIADYAVWLAGNLAALYAAFYLARGFRTLIQRRRTSQKV